MKQARSHERARTSCIGAIASIVTLTVLAMLMPGRYRLAPEWLSFVAAALLATPMLAMRLSEPGSIWWKIERYTTLAAIGITIAVTAMNLCNVIWLLTFHARDVKATPLFGSAIMIWASNTLMFALLYWEIDAGGAEARANADGRYPDFDFPTSNAAPGKAPPNWRPGFADYLFLAFTTATAFSPTDVLPLTTRAKMLVMIEASISLAAIAIVAARTINILG